MFWISGAVPLWRASVSGIYARLAFSQAPCGLPFRW